MPGTVCKQPSPVPEKVSDVIPEMSPELKALLETSNLADQKLLTECICANCGCHPNFTFGCSRKLFCFMCVESKAACNCFHLEKEAPYCEFLDACFCLKCMYCTRSGSCCDFPCPCDADQHCLMCNWSKQVTICAGGQSAKAVCCTNSGFMQCFEKTEVPCMLTDRMFCFECRMACLPGSNDAVPMACSILGKNLWKKA